MFRGGGLRADVLLFYAVSLDDAAGVFEVEVAADWEAGRMAI